MVAKILQTYVLPTLVTCICHYHLQPFGCQKVHMMYLHVFAHVNFLTGSLRDQHTTIGLLEAIDTLVGKQWPFSYNSYLTNLTLARRSFVMWSMRGVTLRSLEICNYLQLIGLAKPYQGSCFGHAMSKTCHYATNNDKGCWDLGHVSLKPPNQIFNNALRGPKNLEREAKNIWLKACIASGLRPKKLSTLVKTRCVLLF